MRFSLLIGQLLLTAAFCYLNALLSPEISVGALYSLVVIYSWLLPWKHSTKITGVFTSILILVNAFIIHSGSNNLSNLNFIIELIVIWTTTFIMTIARDAIKGLEQSKTNLEEKIEERTYELKNSQQRLSSMINVVRDYSIILIDSDGHIQTWNTGAARIFGYNENEIIGRSISTLLTEKDSNSGKHDLMLEQARLSGSSNDQGWRKRKNSEHFYADVVITCVYENDAITGYTAVTRDITKLKALETNQEESLNIITASEERFKLAAQGTNAGIYDWYDIANDKSWWSDQFYKNFGYTAEELPASNESFAKIIHPDDKGEVYQSLQETFDNNKTLFNLKYRVKTKYDGYRWFEVYGAIKRDENNVPIRMVGSLLDIHDEVISKQELQARTEQLEKMNKELEQFAYIATHDLRAPILNLQALMNLFKDRDLVNNENRRIIDRFDNSLNSFSSTLHDLIDITRLRKKEDEGIEVLHLSQLFEEQILLINEQYDCNPELNIDLKTENIKYYPGHIKSIFYNIYSNAVKYRRPDEKLRINITCYKTVGEYVLKIEDNGKGFSMSNVDKVFAMFQRLDNEVDGNGVGLYIIKSLIESNQGSIEVDSEIGVGSTFIVKLKEKTLSKVINQANTPYFNKDSQRDDQKSS